ncbi:MAG: flagellar hook-length control protein FliK, partial [Synergistaceae bacterium]|nr:flagellar hook-length control protein FliK [Synergistaceae bacterium]
NNKNINKNNLVQGDRDLNIINNNRPERVHNDFASFFDGALYNRRTFARAEAAPLNLNLNNNYNYSRAETLREGIVNVIRFTRVDGLHKANMIIDPPAIGRVTVELTSSTSGVEASIKVVNEQVRQLVQDQITELRMTLEQQGVQVTQFAVDVQQDNAGRQQEQQEQSGQGRRRVNALGGLEPEAENGEAEEFRIDLNEGLLYWVA